MEVLDFVLSNYTDIHVVISHSEASNGKLLSIFTEALSIQQMHINTCPMVGPKIDSPPKWKEIWLDGVRSIKQCSYDIATYGSVGPFGYAFCLFCPLYNSCRLPKNKVWVYIQYLFHSAPL